MSHYTADNQELRQALSYFFPVFCWSSPINQRQMQKVRFTPIHRIIRSHTHSLAGVIGLPNRVPEVM